MSEDKIKESLYRSVIETIQNAINYLFLLNGGAIISILTFIGNADLEKKVIIYLSNCILFFIAGVSLAAFSSITLYITQFSYYKKLISNTDPFIFSGTKYRLVLLATLILSCLSFCFGAVKSANAFLM